MNIIFLTLIDINNINDRGIYHDLLRKFRDEGHEVYIISPAERRQGKPTQLIPHEGVQLLKVRTLNIQKTHIVEKGLGTLLLERQYLDAVKKYFSDVKFDLVLYSTPPITLTKVVQYIKERDAAVSYLLLKDIFPQNAVDLGMIRKGSVLHRFFQKKERELYRASDYIGCMSPANVKFIRNHHPEIPSDKVEVNPNSVEPVGQERTTVSVEAIRSRYNIPSDATVFIYGGNLGKPQGIDFLLTVLESNLENDKIFFVVAGGGTEFPKVKDWFDHKQPVNALLLDSMPKEEYDRLVKACDVGLIFLDKRFTIPNFPSRLLSYLEQKMPVLAATDRNTDIGIVLEQAGAGLWVEAGDLAGFNKQLMQLTFPETLKIMGENALQLLESRYTINVSFETIIRKLRIHLAA